MKRWSFLDHSVVEVERILSWQLGPTNPQNLKSPPRKYGMSYDYDWQRSQAGGSPLSRLDIFDLGYIADHKMDGKKLTNGHVENTVFSVAD